LCIDKRSGIRYNKYPAAEKRAVEKPREDTEKKVLTNGFEYDILSAAPQRERGKNREETTTRYLTSGIWYDILSITAAKADGTLKIKQRLENQEPLK